MEQTNEAILQNRDGRKTVHSGKKTAVILTVIAGSLLAVYLGLCGAAALSGTFFPNTTLNGVKISGQTVSQAGKQLEKELPGRTCDIYLNEQSGKPAATVTYADLGARPTTDYASMAKDAYAMQHQADFFSGGAAYLSSLLGSARLAADMTWDDARFHTAVEKLTGEFSYDPQDTSYELGDNCVLVTKAKDGQTVSAEDLSNALETVLQETGNSSITVPAAANPATVLSAQEIYDAVAGEMKNAGYDRSTGTITPEQVGAKFDVAEAERLIDGADPGTVVKVPATIEYPAVTAEQLKGVLFRDVLGSATTHVGGTSARISNVKLATSAVNGTVLNCGDAFSYNGTVGKRTEAKGYQAAPAYVQGETVDEIGGGVCQPSSTLYLACLRSNLEIVERYAHRYVPSYIAKGMDATVSWGGPDYQFRNDTNYPIKIAATYSKGYLTMTLYGTKTDGTTVKMTNTVLSSTAWKTVYQDDNTLTVGTQQVKVTPYTGYKVVTYRNLYDASGNLLTSKQEAVSDYKVRDKLVLVGTKVPAYTPNPGGSSSGETSAETPVETPTQTPVETPAETPAENPAENPAETPAQTPAENPVDTVPGQTDGEAAPTE